MSPASDLETRSHSQGFDNVWHPEKVPINVQMQRQRKLVSLLQILSPCLTLAPIIQECSCFLTCLYTKWFRVKPPHDMCNLHLKNNKTTRTAVLGIQYSEAVSSFPPKLSQNLAQRHNNDIKQTFLISDQNICRNLVQKRLSNRGVLFISL